MAETAGFIARKKGIASRLVAALLPHIKGKQCYATSRVNNDRMHSSLKSGGFEKVGSPYPSAQNEPDIQLFVCKDG